MEFLIPNTWLPALFLSKNYLPDRTWIIVGSSSLHCFPPSSTLSPKITVLFAVSPHLCQVCQASFYRKIVIFFLNRHHYSKVIIWNNLLHFHNAPIFLSKYCKDLIEVPVAKLQSSAMQLWIYYLLLMILIH